MCSEGGIAPRSPPVSAPRAGTSSRSTKRSRQATRRLRERFDGERQPRVVALTAHAGQQAEADAREAGMDDHLSKPLSAERLLAALEKAVPLDVDEGP